jgi:hypothetical protein
MEIKYGKKVWKENIERKYDKKQTQKKVLYLNDQLSSPFLTTLKNQTLIIGYSKETHKFHEPTE